MTDSFFHRRVRYFKEWWRSPVTPKDRRLGAVVGAIGCFWISVIARLIIGPTPVSGSTLGLFALGGIAIGITLGIAFPKVITCVLFPFSIIGGGPSG